MIVLRRIYLRRIFKEFNCSEEDISRNNGSEEDICEEDFLKERLLGRFCQKWWPVWVDILIVDYNYLNSNSYLFQGSIPTFFKFISIKLIPWVSINWYIWSGNINYRMYLSKNNVSLKGCLIKLISIFSAFVNY